MGSGLEIKAWCSICALTRVHRFTGCSRCHGEVGVDGSVGRTRILIRVGLIQRKASILTFFDQRLHGCEAEWGNVSYWFAPPKMAESGLWSGNSTHITFTSYETSVCDPDRCADGEGC